MRNRKINQLGEQAFLQRLLPKIRAAPHQSTMVPPGDDAAILRKPHGLVLSVDGLTDGIHFRSRWDAFLKRKYGFSLGKGLGWKALGSALSDLAAMGHVVDKWAMVFIGVPPQTKVHVLDDIHEGMKDVAMATKCSLVGGDTVQSSVLTLAVSVGGHLKGIRPLRRKKGREGDFLCVCGDVGDASVGLRLLENKIALPSKKAAQFFVRKFFQHKPLFRESQILNKNRHVTSLLDLSDSLIECIPLLLPSHLRADINVDSIPRSHYLGQIKKPERFLLGGGEDYSLLFTLNPAGLSKLQRQLKFSVIGRLEKSRKKVQYYLRGEPMILPKGFRHFKKS